MLFNSYTFICLFLPISWLAFMIAGRAGGVRAAVATLIVASLVFYGWWSVSYLLLLGVLLLVNFGFGRWQELRWNRHGHGSRAILAVILVANLGVLGYFKYAHFFVATAATVTGQPWSFEQLVLPLGISFFMFQKIAYQMDSYRGETRGYGLGEFCAFVLFFPQLIAGPIVYHGEIIPQLRRLSPTAAWAGMPRGMTLFSIGLFKKVILADSLSRIASPVFEAAAADQSVRFLGAWGGVLAYALQLYFDFSGYSDMAVGLGEMFGITLPFNFNSPYQATSITDFWRRWHLTLSRFLKQYLYFPLGGNRGTNRRQYCNLLATMVLGGLWHGAGWTFILWGALHGTYLVLHRAWARSTTGWRLRQSRVWPWIARALTLYAVLIAWVLFRAADMSAAGRLLATMHRVPDSLNSIINLQKAAHRAATVVAPDGETVVMYGFSKQITPLLIFSGWLFVLFAPNTQRIFEVASGKERVSSPHSCTWRRTLAWALATGLIFSLAFFSLTKATEFLYFQF
jgi:alginate O-acetyltransferase complex protein AlgI